MHLSLSSSHCFLQLAQSWLSRIIKYLFIYQFYRRIQSFEHVRSEIQHWLDASSYPGRDFIPPTRGGNNPQRVHLLYRLSPPKVLAITADKGRSSSIQPCWNKRQTILRETISSHKGKKSSQREIKPAAGLTPNSGFLFLEGVFFLNIFLLSFGVTHFCNIDNNMDALALVLSAGDPQSDSSWIWGSPKLFIYYLFIEGFWTDLAPCSLAYET